MSYVIRMSQKPNGKDVAVMEWDGGALQAESWHGAVCALARVAVAAGAPDGPWEGVDSGSGKRRLLGKFLHGLSGLTVAEEEGRSIRLKRYQPYPG